MLGKTNAGGMALNFKIDAYATKNILLADSPKRNTIGVVTGNDITSYIFSPSEPAVPTPGMLWIATGSSSPGTFNAIKKNVVQVSPLYAKQYIGGKWEEVEAMSYIDGAWLDWFKYLYNKGDECVELTGGWKAYPYKTSSSGSSASTPSVTKGSSTIKLSLGDLKAGALFTEKPIDLTDISSLSINVIGVSDSKDTGFLLITKSKRNNYTRDEGVKITDTGLVTLDVSDYEGQYYVAVNLQGSGNKYIEFDRISTRGGTIGGCGQVVLEAKTVTPTKEGFDVKPTPGMALSMVTINPIPNKYQDVSGVTAQEEHVLNGYFFVDSSGELREGTLTDEKEPAVIQSLTVTDNGTYTPPSGVDGYSPVVVNVKTPDGGIVLPELSNPGSEEDLVEGKQLIGPDGSVVDGKVKPGDRYFYQYSGGVDCFFEDGALCFRHMFDKNAIYRAGQSIELYGSDLGNADASHVEKGWTFTSEKGLKIEGSLEVGVQLPTIDDNALGTAEDLAEGKQLIGPDGHVVTGSVTRYTNDDTHTFTGTEVRRETNGKVGIWRVTDKAEMMDAGTPYGLYADGSAFGTAYPGDVRAGTTFTSASGLKIEGTMPNNGSISATIDGLTTTSYKIPAGIHDGSGTVSLSDDIDNIALEQETLIQTIKTALVGKAAGSGGHALVTKTGTTTSAQIDTGLSEIVAIMLKAASQTATGIYTASYLAYHDVLQYTGASVYNSIKSLFTSTIGSDNVSSYLSVNGGVLTWKSTGSTGLISGVSYEWYALGYE